MRPFPVHQKISSLSTSLYSHPLPLVTTDLISMIVDLFTFSKTSYERNPTVWIVLCLTSFAQHNVLGPSLLVSVVPFYCWMAFHCMVYATVYPFTLAGHLGCSLSWAIRVKLLWIFFYSSFCGHFFPFWLKTRCICWVIC